MKTKLSIALCALFIAIAGIVGCQKEEVKSGSAISVASAVHDSGPAGGGTSNCWFYVMTTLVPCSTCESGWQLIPHTYTCCGTQCAGFMAGTAAMPTLSSSDTIPSDSAVGPVAALTSGIRMDIYSGSTFVATVYSDGNGEFDFSDISAGTYTFVESHADCIDRTYTNMVLPITQLTLFPLQRL